MKSNDYARVYATEAEDAQEDNGDDVEITLDNKPYLALGRSLTADRTACVLSYLGIEAADFNKYDVVYVEQCRRTSVSTILCPKNRSERKQLFSCILAFPLAAR